MSMVHKNVDVANFRDAVRTQKFDFRYFRKQNSHDKLFAA